MFRPCNTSLGNDAASGASLWQKIIWVRGSDSHLTISGGRGPIYVCGEVVQTFIDPAAGQVSPGVGVDSSGVLVIDTGLPGIVELCANLV